MTPTTHDLKTAAPYWDAIARGEKAFEVRKDDRGFQRGDTLLLRRLADDDARAFIRPDGAKSSLQGQAKTIRATVSWILTGGQFGVESGYVVMSLSDIMTTTNT